MAIVWSTRASLIEQDPAARSSSSGPGLISPGALAVLKGNPGGKDAVMSSSPAPGSGKAVGMFDKLGQGPANPAADALIPPTKRINPSIRKT
jgi:putative spermidine/putrescine transport system substrate-binding protein